jgi:sulfur-oxidizing protein SoxY
MINRREFAMCVAAGAVSAGLPAADLLAQGPAQGPGQGLVQGEAKGWQRTLQDVLGGGTPVEGKVAIEIAEVIENGNNVPVGVSIEPVPDPLYVAAIHLISTANPEPYVGGFHLTPHVAKASIATRIRLAGTQELIGVAKLSDGSCLIGRRFVKVTVGGCGGSPQ